MCRRFDLSPFESTPPVILEGIVTTRNADGTTNVSPMGPHVEPSMRFFTLRPFKTSRTYANLKQHPFGVLHVTDDVELLAASAIGRDTAPGLVAIPEYDVCRLADTCRWYAFQAAIVDEATERVTIECQTACSGHVRDFFGFNRAKHAVVEGAILATRVHLLPREQIEADFAKLAVIVQKTASAAETRAWKVLEEYVHSQLTR